MVSPQPFFETLEGASTLFQGLMDYEGQAVVIEHESPPRAGYREAGRVPMMGEMHPIWMGTPRLKLAFNQAVAPDFFRCVTWSFCIRPCVIDQLAPIVAIASDFILADDGFVLSYLITPSTHVDVFIF